MPIDYPYIITKLLKIVIIWRTIVHLDKLSGLDILKSGKIVST